MLTVPEKGALITSEVCLVSGCVRAHAGYPGPMRDIQPGRDQSETDLARAETKGTHRSWSRGRTKGSLPKTRTSKQPDARFASKCLMRAEETLICRVASGVCGPPVFKSTTFSRS